MTRQKTLMTLIIVGLFAALVFLSFLQPVTRVSADTVPTPAYGKSYEPGAVVVTLLDTEAFIADNTDTNGIQLYTAEYCNAQYIIDQTIIAQAANTTTLTAQWSMDNSTWSAGPAIVTANAADADGLVQIPMLGRYIGFDVNVTNTNPITIGIKAICK